MNQKLHDNEIQIDEPLVQQLVSEQFPDWVDLSLKQLGASGSSNLLFRLGEDFLVRLPRQPGGGQTILKEHNWQELLNKHLRIKTPQIIDIGRASEIFPEPWSVQRWLPGQRVEAGLDNNQALVDNFSDTIKVLRAMPLPETVSENLRPYRGQPLRQHDRTFRQNIKDCRNIEGLNLDFDRILELWNQGLEQPEAEAPVWFHSDLVAENLLSDPDGALAAILDFGGLGIGDPAIDLHGAWEIFNHQDRQRFRQAMNVSDAEWLRGRAWALAIPMMTFSYYWYTMPDRIRDRMVMIQAVLSED